MRKLLIAALLLIPFLGLAFTSPASAQGVHFVGYSTGSGAIYPTVAALRKAHLDDPSERFNGLGDYINGQGAGCGNYTKLVSWNLPSDSNEIYDVWGSSNGLNFQFQANWCAGAGHSEQGQCIWDNSNSDHGLVLYPCSTSNIDWFFQQQQSNPGAYNYIDIYWNKMWNCAGTNGQQCWDGGNAQYTSWWYYQSV